MFLSLKLDAPLMSFGGVVIDQFNRTDRYPGSSFIVGLLGNALGWKRSKIEQLARLQDRLIYGVRVTNPGQTLTDYQTVDFGDGGPTSDDLGWTTWGRLERRAGASGDGTHIRFREYVSQARVTVVLTLDPADEPPLLEEIANALAHPARPLFLGRKCCIPSRPICGGMVDASSLVEALQTCVLDEESNAGGEQLIVLPRDELPADASVYREFARTEDKDWQNGIHGGRRIYVELPAAPQETQ